MKKSILLLFGVLLCHELFSQHLSSQTSRVDTLSARTLYERISKIEKRTDKLNLFLHTQASVNTYPGNSDTEQPVFKMNQFRLEIKGNVNDRIFYRYRQRLNRDDVSESLDNIPLYVDYAAIGYNITDRFSVFGGKQSIAYGGMEFDQNAIDAYEYSDLGSRLHGAGMGVVASYWVTHNHQLQFQIVNARNGSFEELFGETDRSVRPPKSPLGYTLNWNGGFAENKLHTRWSASLFHDAVDQNRYFFSLGTGLYLSKFQAFLDYMYAREELDEKGIISQLAYDAGHTVRAMDTRYSSWILQTDIRLGSQVNLVLKGMYETAGIAKANNEYTKGKYSTAWGYIGSLEYFPTKSTLHFFLSYVGRSYRYTDRAFGAGNRNSQHLFGGVAYQIPVF